MCISGIELVSSVTSNNAMIAGSEGDVPEVGAMACRGNCGEIAGQCWRNRDTRGWERELNHTMRTIWQESTVAWEELDPFAARCFIMVVWVYYDMTSHFLCSICYTKRGVWPVIDFCSEADEEFAKRIELDRVGRIQENVPKENTLELANSFQGRGSLPRRLLWRTFLVGDWWKMSF
jgi:hypothetical protein